MIPTVLCVLKSGGVYTKDYVIRLRNMVARHSTVPYHFACLTDMVIPQELCENIPLKSNLPGWWSKLELFRSDLPLGGQAIYFDLDTLIVNNIDNVLRLSVDFGALGDWFPGPNRSSKNHFGTGMMVWDSTKDWSFLHTEFDIRNKPRNGWNSGDQYYIVTSLTNRNIKYQTLQDLVSGIYSYKRNCLKGFPKDSCVICFHGRPRPHEALHVGWVRDSWR